jgi:hypothetical protein
MYAVRTPHPHRSRLMARGRAPPHHPRPPIMHARREGRASRRGAPAGRAGPGRPAAHEKRRPDPDGDACSCRGSSRRASSYRLQAYTHPTVRCSPSRSRAMALRHRGTAALPARDRYVPTSPGMPAVYARRANGPAGRRTGAHAHVRSGSVLVHY